MLAGTNLKYARNHNLRTVLETIRLHGPLARKEIAGRTGLTLQTVSNITRGLLESELIVKVDSVQDGRGAPSALLHIHARGGFSIGLDFDREHLAGVLVDLRGEVLSQMSKPLRFPSPNQAIELMEAAVNELIRGADVSRSRIWGVGVGLPGPFGTVSSDESPNVINPAAFPGWINVPVADSLSERLSLPVFVENNATAAAIGERWYGKAKHLRSFFYLFFGIGLGGGLVIDGRPTSGFFGNAGEIGLIPVFKTDEPDESFGSHVGEFFSLIGLAKSLEKVARVVRPEDLAPLFEQRNEIFMEWLEHGIRQLVPLIHAIECLLDPQVIMLGGRYPEPIIAYIWSRLYDRVVATRVPEGIPAAELLCASAGPDVTALGVATLPLYSSFAPITDVLTKHVSTESAELISSFVDSSP